MTETPANPMTPDPFRIERIRKETGDTFTLDLTPTQSSAPFSFKPGQFNMLYVFGIGEAAISISGDPRVPEKLIHTVRDVGTVTNAMRLQRRGGVLGVRGPYGTHWPLEHALGKDIVIAAGGLGLAPLRPALYSVAANRERYGAVTLCYGARTADDLLYRREFELWRTRCNIDVRLTVDRATDDWDGRIGLVTALLPAASLDPSRTVAFACGPDAMMRATADELLRRGLSAEAIFVSLERNMKCAVGYCGHCQYGPEFICKDGPIFSYGRVKDLLTIREL